MCFVFIWEQTATCATYNINWLVFITEMKSVYSAVRTGYLNVIQFDTWYFLGSTHPHTHTHTQHNRQYYLIKLFVCWQWIPSLSYAQYNWPLNKNLSQGLWLCTVHYASTNRVWTRSAACSTRYTHAVRCWPRPTAGDAACFPRNPCQSARQC